ncbi:MAG: sulfurtransferase TusA family protein [Alphaproteobacteria bacterium]|nr:sulfurtransferase TusA family protein [Alphaproteobacteria bacterium]
MHSTTPRQDSTVADVRLDITDQICPLTFVRTKLTIERMEPGQVVEVRIKGAEPLKNVPRSVEEFGHTVLGLEPEGPDDGPNGVHILLIRKETA